MINRFEDDYVLLERYRDELSNPQTLPTHLLIIAGISKEKGNVLIKTTDNDILQQSIGIDYLLLSLELYLVSYQKISLRLCKECFESISHKLLLMLEESDERRAKVEQLIAEYNQIQNK